MKVLKELRDEQGKNIEEMKLLHTLDIDPTTGTVNIKLNLT